MAVRRPDGPRLLAARRHGSQAALEAATEKLLWEYWPLVRRLARALVEHKEISARSCRRLLLAAMRKDLRRSRAVAEKDRRHQQAWGAELRQALGRVK